MNGKEVVKQIVGIDISKDSFYACFKVLCRNSNVTIKGTKSFSNSPSGFKTFLEWCEKRNKTPHVAPIHVMEATGVYYEDLAYFLYHKKQLVSVQLAQKVKYFAKSCNLKTKTDKVDAKMIAEYGIEKNLTELWRPPSNEFKMIRDLSREHTSLIQAQTAAKSQLHALNFAHGVNKEVIKLKEEQIAFYSKHIAAIEKEIKKMISADQSLESKIENIKKIKGLSLITIVKVLAETNGFLLFRNIRQLVSYAGLDVIEKESGTFKGRTKISKKGNARIRSALYMPAMSAARFNSNLKAFYERVNDGRAIKRQGTIAVMRKLLILIYTLWKKDVEYVENYKSVSQKQLIVD